MTHKQVNMSKFKELQAKAEKRGDFVGHLLPANWIELKGRFTVAELETIAKAVKNNYKTTNN